MKTHSNALVQHVVVIVSMQRGNWCSAPESESATFHGSSLACPAPVS